MTKWWPIALVLIGLGIVLLPVHLGIAKRQTVVDKGRSIYLPLGFIAADTDRYRKLLHRMGVARLKFPLVLQLEAVPGNVSESNSGLAFVQLDERDIVVSARIPEASEFVSDGSQEETALAYNGRGHNGYTIDHYPVEPPDDLDFAYAHLRVGPDGTSVFTGFANTDLQPVWPEQAK